MGGTRFEFTARWGKMVRVASLLVTLVLVAIPAVTVLAVDGEDSVPAVVATGSICMAILLGTALFTVRGYILSGRKLLVRRLLWNTVIDLSGLRTVEVDETAMREGIQILGNGGVFGITGRYRTRSQGQLRAFVTDLHSCVVLNLPEGKVIISPEDPERFAEVVSTFAGG